MVWGSHNYTILIIRTLIIYPVESFLVPAVVGNLCWMGRDDVSVQTSWLSLNIMSVLLPKPRAWKHSFWPQEGIYQSRL